MHIVLVLILVCRLSSIWSMHQDLNGQAGIKLCTHRCLTTDTCSTVTLNSGILYCQLTPDSKTKKSYPATTKLSYSGWKYVPHPQCEARHRLPGNMSDEFKTAADSRGSSGIADDNRISNQKSCTGFCQCRVGMHYDPKRNKCVKACRKYGTTITLHKGYAVHQSNDASWTGISLSDCKRRCLTSPKFICKTIVYGKVTDFALLPNVCCISRKNYFQLPKKAQEFSESWTLGVRNCEQ